MNVFLELISSWDYGAMLQIYQSGGNVFLDWIAVMFSRFGTFRVGALLLGIFFWLKKETQPITIILFSAVLFSGLCTLLIKEIVDRPRPYIELGLSASQLLIVTDPTVSFPSGHTTSAFATASVVVYYFRKWAAPALLIAGIAGLSRIYLLVHYPSDVFAGAAIGILSAALVIAAYQRQYGKIQKADT